MKVKTIDAKWLTFILRVVLTIAFMVATNDSFHLLHQWLWLDAAELSERQWFWLNFLDLIRPFVVVVVLAISGSWAIRAFEVEIKDEA
jgi:hypothetical protein